MLRTTASGSSRPFHPKVVEGMEKVTDAQYGAQLDKEAAP